MKCSICGSTKIVREDKLLGIFNCEECSHTFTMIPKSEQEDYNPEYFMEQHKNWFNNPNLELFNLLYKKIKRNEKIKLIDVGCGKGDFLEYVAKIDTNIELFGIDLVDNMSSRIHYMKGDFMKKKFKQKFDVVVSLAVIEHVENPNAFVKRIKEILKPNGRLYLMTINNDSLMYVIARFLKKIGARTAYNRLYSHHHLQHYTNRSLKKLLTQNGFKMEFLKNHNYTIKAVDVPKSNKVVEKLYKLVVFLIFMVSGHMRRGMMQTLGVKRG